MISFAFSSIASAVVVPKAEPTPITKSSAESSNPIWKSCALPSNTILVSSAPASPIVKVGVVPPNINPVSGTWVNVISWSFPK